MIRKRNLWQKSFVPVLLTLFALAGCTAKTTPIWGNPETGLLLEYRLPVGESLTYESISTLHQTVDIMGQIQEVEGGTTSSITFESKGKKEDNIQVQAKINAMDIHYASAQGEISPDTDGVVGKSFHIIMSSTGKELELIGIEELTVDMGADGIRDLSSDFQDSFPDLAGHPVKLGDTWTSTTPIKVESSVGASTLTFTNTYTLEDFETLDGRECVKIKMDTKGTYEGTTEQGGMELQTGGEIVGTGYLYFAYKEGIYVKITSEGTAEGFISVPSQGLELPLSREFKSECSLVK